MLSIVRECTENEDNEKTPMGRDLNPIVSPFGPYKFYMGPSISKHHMIQMKWKKKGYSVTTRILDLINININNIVVVIKKKIRIRCFSREIHIISIM